MVFADGVAAVAADVDKAVDRIGLVVGRDLKSNLVEMGLQELLDNWHSTVCYHCNDFYHRVYY